MRLSKTESGGDFPSHIKTNMADYAALLNYTVSFWQSSPDKYFARFISGKVSVYYYYPAEQLIKVYYNKRLINIHTGGWDYLLTILKCFSVGRSCN